MYAVEDFRDAPMRTLATAETREEAHRIAASLGITGHEFIRPIKGNMADAVAALEARPALLFNVSELEDRADDAERQTAETERENDRLHGRISKLLDEKDELTARLNKITQPSLPTEAA